MSQRAMSRPVNGETVRATRMIGPPEMKAPASGMVAVMNDSAPRGTANGTPSTSIPMADPRPMMAMTISCPRT
jgi:hypothetical protein